MIDELVKRTDVFADLNQVALVVIVDGKQLALYRDLDDVLLGLAVHRREKTSRSVILWIKNLLRLRRDIDLVDLRARNHEQIGDIVDTLSSTRSQLIQAIVSSLRDSEWEELKSSLDAYFDASLDLSSLGGNQRHQLCLFIRAGLSGALDVNRSLYLQAMSDTQRVISQYQTDRTGESVPSRVVPFDVKQGYSAARGYTMIVANKFKTQLPAFGWRCCVKGREFVEVGKERNGQTVYMTPDLISLNRKCV